MKILKRIYNTHEYITDVNIITFLKNNNKARDMLERSGYTINLEPKSRTVCIFGFCFNKKEHAVSKGKVYITDVYWMHGDLVLHTSTGRKRIISS